MGISAIATGLFSLASAGIAAHGAKSAAAANAAAQSDLNAATMRFNSDEAHVARVWQSNEAYYDRLFSAEQAEIGRQYSERLASTAHQREAADLKAAGLNPILAANGGSATPAAVIGSSHLPSGAVASAGAMKAYERPNILGNFVSSALEGLRLENDFKRSSIEAKNAETKETEAETNRMNADTAKKRLSIDEAKVNKEIESIDNSISIALKDLHIREELKDANIEKIHTTINDLLADIDLKREQTSKIGIEKDELERRIRYGALLSNYLPLEAREIVGNHMIDFLKDNKEIIDDFLKNASDKYTLSNVDEKDFQSKWFAKIMDWAVEKGYLSSKK